LAKQHCGFRQQSVVLGAATVSSICFISSSQLVIDHCIVEGCCFILTECLMFLHMQEIAQILGAAESERSSLTTAMAQLQKRFDAREPRPEDVAAIADLKATLAAREEALQTAENRVIHLRNEMLLREENYNKHFRNGGVGERVLDVGGAASADSEVMDWMLNSGRRRMTGDRHSSGGRGAGAMLGPAHSGVSPAKGLPASFKRERL
jgi:hypothetical protein